MYAILKQHKLSYVAFELALKASRGAAGGGGAPAGAGVFFDERFVAENLSSALLQG